MLGITTVLGGVLILLAGLNYRLKAPSPSGSKSVGLIVLGDIGRSPRMLYHAQSFLQNGYTTYIVAYRGSNPPRSLTENEKCHFVYLSQPLAFSSKLPKIGFLFIAPFKVLFGALYLLSALLFIIPQSPTFFFVQNPPSIPTLPIVQLAVWLRSSRLVIDWHNTGHSVLSLRLGSEHPVVKIAKKIEMWFGKRACAHLMVTDTMRQQLVKEAKLEGKAIAFHDRPPKHFRRQTNLESHELFQRLPVLKTINFPPSSENKSLSSADSTILTSSNGSLLPNRPALVVTSTSHTPDEDLTILLEALTIYEQTALSSPSASLPRLVMLVTGKGSGKQSFESSIHNLESLGKLGQFVQIRTTWLELEDYPKLLGSSDLGISLHSSTSGYDLPMKVVDMFGCELPVLALDFESIGELVKDGVNGRTFKTAKELSKQLIDLLSGFPSEQSCSKLEELRKGIKLAKYGRLDSVALKKVDDGEQWANWEQHWDRLLLPLLDAHS
ncbi:hypothetical protein JCM5350_005121 [Sporobolomyces pararoseus]